MPNNSLVATDEYHRITGELTTAFKTRMAELGMRTADLGERTNLSPKTVSNILNCKGSTISLHTIVIIAKALDMRVGVLLDKL